ncbi:hypothetical protein BDV96DRAFT_650639 [Lophiotrema nucula]|uniref:Uncharacterized protein n=1 Tax=Lophiotrema nucula TaxID=690887 RepID=A0A6A5YY59_9PLEO|nr:hypothetical protein BDV96DRAFT_650639 [Lophiotrema nucula]
MFGDPGLPLGREHRAINSIASIKPADGFPADRLESQLRRGWGHLCFQHPRLAARVAEDQISLIYEIPSPNELKIWMAKTFVIAKDESSAAEVIATLRPEPHALLIYVPQSFELLGHSSH